MASRKDMVGNFLALVEAGATLAVMKALKEMPSLAQAVRPKDKHGMLSAESALHIAAKAGNLEMSRVLVAAGAVVDLNDFVRQSPLVVAAQYGRTEVVEYLLSKKADPNHAVSEGYRALMYAVRNGHGAAAKLLLKNKADINAQADAKDTALHFTLYAEPIAKAQEMIQLLMDHGIDPAITNIEGRTAAQEARSRGKDDLAIFIEDYAEQLAQAKDAEAVSRRKALEKISTAFHTGTERAIPVKRPAKFTPKV